MLNIDWFSTGRDAAARQLLQTVQNKIRCGDVNGRISFVFSNREPREAKESDMFFDLVRTYDTPLVCLSNKEFKAAGTDRGWRIRYGKEVDKRIRLFAPDLCVLAGYMLIVGEELCQKYDMINLHPAPGRTCG